MPCPCLTGWRRRRDDLSEPECLVVPFESSGRCHPVLIVYTDDDGDEYSQRFSELGDIVRP
jgi:hypothetical protein